MEDHSKDIDPTCSHVSLISHICFLQSCLLRMISMLFTSQFALDSLNNLLSHVFVALRLKDLVNHLDCLPILTFCHIESWTVIPDYHQESKKNKSVKHERNSKNKAPSLITLHSLLISVFWQDQARKEGN